VEAALKANATHILFVDSDQSFPPDTLRRLLSWNVPVVGCNVAVKKFPSCPTVREKSADSPKGTPIFTTEDSTGLQRVWRMGTGVMLVDMRVFAKLGEKPWFNLLWHEEENDFEGEDWFFCRKVEAAGYFIYIDQGLSWQIGHLGSLDYKHDFVIAAKMFGEAEDEEIVVDTKEGTLIPELKRDSNHELGEQPYEDRQGQATDGRRLSEEVRVGGEAG